jgi:hypothetical protein
MSRVYCCPPICPAPGLESPTGDATGFFRLFLRLKRRRAVHVLTWRRDENGGSRMKGKLIAIFLGLSIAAGSWAPLMIVEARDRYAMPVGLGLFAIAGSFIGGVIALVGLIRLVIQASRASKARSGSA